MDRIPTARVEEIERGSKHPQKSFIRSTPLPKGAEPHPRLNFGFPTGLFSRDVFESFGSLEGRRRGGTAP